MNENLFFINTYEDLKDYGAEKAWLKIQSID